MISLLTLATILLALIAVPLARSAPRESRFRNFSLALVVYVALFSMTSVLRTNQLLLDYHLYCAQRQKARFINTGMIATLSGAVASDALEDGTVISGVGGQYNFVAMAHELHDQWRRRWFLRDVDQPAQQSGQRDGHGHRDQRCGRRRGDRRIDVRADQSALTGSDASGGETAPYRRRFFGLAKGNADRHVHGRRP